MSGAKRFFTTAGFLLQGYAFYALWSRSLVWPLIWPKGPALYVCVWLLYFSGYLLMNAMLTSELIEKTQLEADQIAARQIQQTLIPEKLEDIPGYEVESFYQPFRAVGGDYFDVIPLAGGRTLFALADVSGKGIAAALLAANIQALVRSLASVDPRPLTLARQINQHLSRYSPSDRFATAVFLLLDPDSGELTYVNAGHPPPIVSGLPSITLLEATGTPLGLMSDASYEEGKSALATGGSLLLFTDGLTDSITGNAFELMGHALDGAPDKCMSKVKSLMDVKSVEDDVTILLARRLGNAAGT